MFGTSGIRGPVGDRVTGELALSLGRAVGSEGYDRVVVGRDVRESGEFLQSAAVAGLRESGADVVTVGVAATPTIARAVSTYGADAGIAITASHNPPADNGFKLWTPSGRGFDADRRAAIADRIRADEYDLQPWDGLGSVERRSDAVDRHARTLREAVSVAEGLEVVVDVGNGAGGITPRVLSALGCSVVTLNGQPDGAFPGRPSEPTAESLADLEAFVGATDADLGIAHDGDADRTVAVDGEGRFVPKDVLLALFAREAASEGDRIAAPVDTSLAVDDALAAVGASVRRTPVGDVHVAEAATAPDVVFGGEPSGAWIWPAETLCPDGPLAACRLVELVADRGPLADLVDAVETYPIRRTSIEAERPDAVVSRLRETARERYGTVDDLDGVRVDTGDGWLLVRASGTQPLVRITAEAREADRAEELFAEATELVSGVIDGRIG